MGRDEAKRAGGAMEWVWALSRVVEFQGEKMIDDV